MDKASTFEELYVWQDALQLSRDIFTLFEDCHQLSLKWQIERASISISANIAEGFELGTKKQFIKHLNIAKGSCGEVRSLFYFAIEIGTHSEAVLKNLIERAKRLSIMIYKLIQHQKGKDK